MLLHMALWAYVYLCGPEEQHLEFRMLSIRLSVALCQHPQPEVGACIAWLLAPPTHLISEKQNTVPHLSSMQGDVQADLKMMHISMCIKKIRFEDPATRKNRFLALLNHITWTSTVVVTIPHHLTAIRLTLPGGS